MRHASTNPLEHPLEALVGIASVHNGPLRTFRDYRANAEVADRGAGAPQLATRIDGGGR